MCGIIGYIGNKKAVPILLDGLERESYRGYDSSGIVVFGNEPCVMKAVGKLEQLKEKVSHGRLEGFAGLGHSRWATHGGVTEENAHPHQDCTGSIFVVHNGIIENYRALKEALLQEGHVFVSETDTEVLPHLIEKFFAGNIEEAVRSALKLVRGSYGIAVIARQDPGKIVAARLSSPLVLSINSHEAFVASDPAALLPYSRRMIFLEDGEIAVIGSDSYVVIDRENRQKKKDAVEIEWSVEDAEKQGYSHFMEKEIMEQRHTIQSALERRLQGGAVQLEGMEAIANKLKNVRRVQLLACGTASYATRVAAYMLEEYAKLPCTVDVASEYRYRGVQVDAHTLSVFVSQSGETADTLAALESVKQQGGLTVGVVNVVGSALARGVDATLYTRAGIEVAVASTKAFTAQLASLALLTLFLGEQRGLPKARQQELAQELARIPGHVQTVLERKEKIASLAATYREAEHFFIIGRKYQYPVALEGALKLKETAYVHAEGTAGGELKHGSLALIEPRFPTIALVPSDSVREKMLSNIQEIKARSGRVLAIASEGDVDIESIADDVIFIPHTEEMLTPMLSGIPLQLFAYYLGVGKGYDVDKPRNLAKSVTVE